MSKQKPKCTLHPRDLVFVVFNDFATTMDNTSSLWKHHHLTWSSLDAMRNPINVYSTGSTDDNLKECSGLTQLWFQVEADMTKLEAGETAHPHPTDCSKYFICDKNGTVGLGWLRLIWRVMFHRLRSMTACTNWLDSSFLTRPAPASGPHRSSQDNPSSETTTL